MQTAGALGHPSEDDVVATFGLSMNWKQLDAMFVKWGYATRNCVRREITKSAYVLQGVSRRYAPADTGTLRRSIRVRFYDRGYTASIYSNQDLAFWQEFGTGPSAETPQPSFEPPPENLEKWADRHPPWDAQLLADYIGEVGIKPKGFMGKAFAEKAPGILRDLRLCVAWGKKKAGTTA